MSDEWQPREYHDDPMVNTVLNAANQLRRPANATDNLLYGLKYGAREGLSIAQATEKSGDTIAQAIRDLAHELPVGE